MYGGVHQLRQDLVSLMDVYLDAMLPSRHLPATVIFQEGCFANSKGRGRCASCGERRGVQRDEGALSGGFHALRRTLSGAVPGHDLPLRVQRRLQPSDAHPRIPQRTIGATTVPTALPIICAATWMPTASLNPAGRCYHRSRQRERVRGRWTSTLGLRAPWLRRWSCQHRAGRTPAPPWRASSPGAADLRKRRPQTFDGLRHRKWRQSP